MPENKKNKPKIKNTKQTMLRLMRYMTKNWILLGLVVVLVIISSATGVIGTYMLKPIINDYIVPLTKIGVQNLTAESFIPFIKALAVMAAVYLSGALASFAYIRIIITLSQKSLNRMRRDLFENLQTLPISYFDKHTHGEIMSRFTNDVDTVREAISSGVLQLISSAITIVTTFIMMIVLSPLLTLLIVVMLGVMIGVIRIIGGKSATYFRKQQKNLGEVNGYIEELIEGQKVVKVFGREEAAKEKFALLSENLRESATKAHTFASVLMPIMGNISYINYALTATLGAILIIRGIGGMDIGSLAAFLQYTRQISQPITQVSQQFNSLISALAGAERIFEIIDAKSETDDGYVTLVNAIIDEDGNVSETDKKTNQWAWKHPHENGTITYTPLKGAVNFHDVTFSYDGKKDVLKNISLWAKPGQKIAFVGSTGAGKTTITNLINRFYDVTQGKISYDGINIKKIKKDDLRRSLAMVLQDTHLFTGTVRENIAYGRLDATDEEIENAAKLANAHSFIKRLPNGYDTLLSADGTNLSQGQRQLLSIARAAVADPPVLILDEATSSIDTRTERLIEKGMDSLMKGRTVFVIAHRLSTVRNSNAIMVLENGEIIERGDHEDLIAQQGKYYQLYTGQFELE